MKKFSTAILNIFLLLLRSHSGRWGCCVFIFRTVIFKFWKSLIIGTWSLVAVVCKKKISRCVCIRCFHYVFLSYVPLPLLPISQQLVSLCSSSTRCSVPLNIGEILVPLLYRQNYLAAEHRRNFGCFIIQTELPRRWTSARFWFLYYTDRITSSLIIGEILVPLLYRQNYLVADHRRDFGSFIMQTELPRRWSSARFWLLYYADRITSPLIIGEIFVRYIREIKLSHIPTFT